MQESGASSIGIAHFIRIHTFHSTVARSCPLDTAPSVRRSARVGRAHSVGRGSVVNASATGTEPPQRPSTPSGLRLRFADNQHYVN